MSRRATLRGRRRAPNLERPPLVSTRALSLWFLAVASLGAVSRTEVAARRSGRCSLDGVTFGAAAEVELVERGVVLARFCCATCAADWPDVPTDAWWRVRDEVTGEALDAAEALFVESRVPTSRARRDHLHAFASLRDALAHAEQFGGRLVPRPLPPPPPDPDSPRAR